MILADKIILERKKNGWSQEELANRLGVTRQAVSKWEGAQSTPDLQRILEMSKLFGVSVDYLLKDEMEESETISEEEGAGSELRTVTMEEANEFMAVKQETAPRIAFGVMLCIFSPICLIFLAICAELKALPISENAAGGIGMIVLFAMVAVAVGIFISCGMKTKDYEFLEKEEIETAYGVSGMVKERRQKYQPTYSRYNVIGAMLCIFGVITLFCGSFFEEEEILQALCLCMMLVIEAFGVRLFVIAGIMQASFEKLLQEGEYTVDEKKKSPVREMVGTIYWLIITAIFLAIGFTTNKWNVCAFIWPVAGVLFPVVLMLVRIFEKKEK